MSAMSKFERENVRERKCPGGMSYTHSFLPAIVTVHKHHDLSSSGCDILCYKSLLRHALHCLLSVLQRYRPIQFTSGDYCTITDRVSGEDNAIGHVRLFACFTLSFEQVTPAERR